MSISSFLVLFFCFISYAHAAINIEEKIDILQGFSLPLLLVSIVVLFYSIIRLLEYRRIIERKNVELKESEERYSVAAQGANDGLWDWNLKTNEIYFSSRWKAMIGYSDEEIGHSPNDWFNLIHPDDIENLKNIITAHFKEPNINFDTEYRIKHKDETYMWVLCRGLAIQDAEGRPVRMAGSQTDITLRKQMEEQLIYDAFHDGLTGLANRALFIDRLKISFARRKRRKDHYFAVLFLDLDRFKNVNDSFGHLFGNKLLTEVAKRLGIGLRGGDTCARFGGDEFAILLDDIDNPGFSKLVASRIQNDLLTPFSIENQEIFISVSIGIAICESYNRPEDMVRDADIAMYKAKFCGRGCYMLFDETMRTDVLSYLQLETDLRQAIERQELSIFYQPILSLESKKIVGFEALLRWHHKERGLIPSSEFIPLAEETGLIIPIGNWVFQESCTQLCQWQKEFPTEPPLSISINVSNRQFVHENFIEQIKKGLAHTGLNPQSLHLEITESFMVEDEKIQSVLSELKNMNIQIHIDDFGTGYSSLSYIHKFPVSALKIDKSFIARIGDQGEDSEIVKAIVNLAHNLNLEVIAEGVEKTEHLPILKALECKYVQGYLFSEPMNSKEAENLLSTQVNQ
jgi:diguanylate cyclase (GGDEF)-like protein/PAS domain S-box-containing protein